MNYGKRMMSLGRRGILAAAVAGLATACTQTAEVYVTSADASWRQAAAVVRDADGGKEADIVVSDEEEQVFDGLGGTFGELGWDALALLSAETRGEVMQALFGPDGIRLAYGRIPMGANDFARGYYTCNDSAGDFAMEHFSIARDREALIPFAKEALEVNPKLKFWASPWTPPVWMKATRHYATAPGDHNDFTEANRVDGDHLKQEPEYLKAWALYQSKFVEAYQKEGIDISLVMFQNEPYTENQWPNCRWTPEAMARFIGGYLGPQFARDHHDVELYFGTFNCNRMEELERVMEDTAASRYLTGVGLQWEGKDIVAEVHQKYPGLKLMQTENECGSGTFDWAAAEHTFDLMKAYLDGGVNTYMYFNMVLRDDGASSWGWKQNALVRVMSDTKEAVYTPEYYLLKHVGRFVEPGARKLKVAKGEDVLAFRNPDGGAAVLCVNKDTVARDVRVACEGQLAEWTLQPKSFNTIIFK